MKRFFLLLIVVMVGIFAAGTFWWINETNPVNAQATKGIIFVVDKGESTRQIGIDLQHAGLIRNPWVFFLLVKMSGYDKKLQSGDFRLSSSQTPQQILQTMMKGSIDIWVTIPEGKRATEIAEILKENLPNYDPSWSAKLATQEGYLFPDTYLFPRDVTIDQIITTMEDNFAKKYAQAQLTQTNKMNQHDAIILASIVEREASSAHDMQYVASTFENRLAIGMALGSDVTVEYALGYQPQEQTWWKKNLTTTDLNIDSPYNTRKFAGLPPTPISNPGLTAIKAVLNPPPSDYLYFIADSKGIIHFAKTIEEHEANVKKYGE